MSLSEDEAIAVIEDARDNSPGDDPDRIGSKDITESISRLIEADSEPELESSEPEEQSTTVDTLSEDDRKACASRAIQALTKFKKNAGQLGLLGPELERMINLIEDRLEAV